MGRTSRRSLRHFLLYGFVICAPAYADTTYVGSFTTANNTATYSITTDGALGTLAQSDILSASFSDTGTVAFSTMVASGIYLSGDDLSATALSLSFNFGDSGPTRFYLCASACGFSGGTTDWLFWDSAGGGWPTTGALGVVNESVAGEAFLESGQVGVIATATPEPASLVTTLVGSMILVLVALKRRLHSRPF